jgi:hypothetical protein
MNAEISGLLRAAAQPRRGARSVAIARVRTERHVRRRASCSKNITPSSAADIDMPLWIRHLSPTAAPRRQYPDL